MDRTDSRFALCQLLMRYRPSDPGDRAQRDRILAFVESERNCYERTTDSGHVTGSAWVVDGSGTKVLLTHHRKLGKWLQLGGHADGNPDVLAVALREVREESGLTDVRALSEEIFDVDVHPIPARGDEPAHVHYDMRFAVQASSSDPLTTNEESNEIAWVEIKKLSSLTNEESMSRMARKWERMRSSGAGFGNSGARR